MKYLLPILFLVFAVFFAFAVNKYGLTVAAAVGDLGGQAVHTKPVANFLQFIFSR